MKKPIFFNKISRWVNQQALRTLEDAYQGAVAIKAIEDKHFGGKKIAPDVERGKSVFDYFQSTLERQLTRIRLDLAQFRASNFFVPTETTSEADPEAEILEKLSFIESIISKYRTNPDDIEILKEMSAPTASVQPLSETSLQEQPTNEAPNPLSTPPQPVGSRSSFFKLRRELTPEYEQEVIQQLRSLRQQQRTAIRFLLLLIIVPFLVQVATKNLLYSPLINYWRVDQVKVEQIEISKEIGEKYLAEFAHEKELLEAKILLDILPEFSVEEKQKYFKEKAKELLLEAGYKTRNGIKNFLADLTSLGAFALIVYLGRPQFIALRIYLSRVFLGLNDITKVFIFILLTDMFVGFHSAEGWEVIIDSVTEHFGFSENRNFTYLFIATVPVIMDSIFKLLIFNFLTRKSPTAVAILEKMNQ